MVRPGVRFVLNLLGPPTLVASGGEAVKLRTKKQLALLGRLAWEAPRGLTRDHLVDFLWPGVEPAAARHSLAQALSALRAVLGRDAVVTERGLVAVRPGVVAIDIRSPGLDGVALTSSLFEGFDIPGVAAFELWKDQVAAETWPALRAALLGAIERAKSVARFAEVEALGLQLLRRDPLCEAGIEACMQGRALAGDRISALKLFDQYSGRIRAELGAEPSDGLRRAAANLRRGAVSRDRPLSIAGEPRRDRSAFKPVPLVGRGAAYGELRSHWLAAQRGEPRLVVVVGDPGIGKSTLAMMLAAAAHAEGAAVARVQPHETERTAPYALLSELVRQVTCYPGAAATSGDALAELSRICQVVRVHFPGVTEAPPAMPETVHLRLTEALLGLLDSVAEEEPVLLVVDDIHLADDASLTVLQRVARKMGSRRVLLCYTAPDQELTPLLAERDRDETFVGVQWHRLALGPLPEADARALVRERLQDVDAAVLGEVEERLVKQARGNPLALEMLMLDWRSHGPRSLLYATEAVTGGIVEPSRIPDPIRQAFERQRAALGEPAREVLDLAAVLGHRLLDLDVYQALGASPMRVAEASRQLLAAGIWTDVGTELEFRNELLRTHAYLSIPRQARVALHSRVAGVLASRGTPDTPATALELAWHLWRAERRVEAVALAIDGAERCLLTFAPRTAERVASDLLAESIGEVERSRLSYVLGRALAMQSRLRAAEEPLRRATVDGLLNSLSRTDAELRLADLLMKRASASGAPEALSLTQQALSHASGLGDTALMARAYHLLTQALIDADRESELHENLAQLDAIASQLDQPHAHVELALGFVRAHAGQLEAAHTQLRTAVNLFAADGNIEELAYAYNGLGVTLHRLGHWSESRSAFQNAHRYYGVLENRPRQAQTLSNAGAVEFMVGNYGTAVKILQNALCLSQPAEHARFEIEVTSNLLLCALASGDLHLAEEALRGIADIVDEDAHWQVRVAALLAQADFDVATGTPQRAVRRVQAARALAAGREHRVVDLDQLVRLEALRLVHQRRPETARHWLKYLSDVRILQSRVSTKLLVAALSAWIDEMLEPEDVPRLKAAISELAEAQALGVIDELRWCGVFGGSFPLTQP